MKIRIYIQIFLLLLLMSVSQSCVNDYEGGCTDGNRGEVRFCFNLRLGDTGHLSRADGIWNPAGPSVGGNTFDNTIVMNDDKAKWLHVMIINKDGDILHLDLENGFQLNSVEGGYDMTATLDLTDPDMRAKWTAGEYRVMVLANFRERLDPTKNDTHFNKYKTISELESKIKNWSADWYDKDIRNSSNTPYIPMWGMTKAWFNFDGVSTQTFSIDLLRSVAKVKIRLTDKLKDAGYSLVNDCYIENMNKKVYGLPNGWKDAERTSDTTQPNYDAAFRENANGDLNSMKINETTIPSFKYENDGDGSLVFYLPEWSATDTKRATIKAQVMDDLGVIEECSMEISNESLGLGYYKNNIYNVNRNHLYQFTLDKEIKEGEMSYKLECWNLEESAIGWNPPEWSFSSTDSEANCGYVSFPSYDSGSKELIQNTTSFADYVFTLQSPSGAVWKAFLVEDGVEYTAEDKFMQNIDGTVSYKNAANTPNGFFFGVGNEDDKNQKAASTGIARPEAYNIKVGTRMQTTDFKEDKTTPITLADNNNILALNESGNYWKYNNSVPTCYLIIKIALDGKNFTECLAINPSANSGHFVPFKFAGDATMIEIRQLPPFYAYKKKGDQTLIDNERFIIGINNKDDNSGKDYLKYTWWSYPMGYKNPKSSD